MTAIKEFKLIIHQSFLCIDDNKSSNWLSSLSSTLTIHAFSYGDSLTNSGLSSNSSFDSTTLPDTGAYNSETVLTDSTLPKVSLR